MSYFLIAYFEFFRYNIYNKVAITFGTVASVIVDSLVATSSVLTWVGSTLKDLNAWAAKAKIYFNVRMRAPESIKYVFLL